MSHKNTFTSAIFLTLSVLMLSACTRSVSDVDSAGQTQKPVFPDAHSAVRPDGSFVNVDNLNQVRPGMTKAQLYELLGAPHFDEGIIRVKEWDYIFHFTRSDKTVETCQYKVLFDSNLKAQSFFFMPENCQIQQEASPVSRKELRAESLFAFASAKISAEGAMHLRQIAQEINQTSLKGKRIIVTGHTDRIGHPDDNLDLSFARAASVKRMLVELGIPHGLIEIRGMGSSMPVVFCPGPKSTEVIQCLAPNRRMTLDIIDN